MCIEIALLRLWALFSVKPSVVIGHSLGEYATLNAAGIFSDSDTIFLVGTRATLLEARCTRATHGMVSVRASHENVLKAADGIAFEVACINGPKETVVGGAMAHLEALTTVLGKAGYGTIRLNVPHAYHTSQMEVWWMTYRIDACCCASRLQSPSFHLSTPKSLLPILMLGIWLRRLEKQSTMLVDSIALGHLAFCPNLSSG